MKNGRRRRGSRNCFREFPKGCVTDFSFGWCEERSGSNFGLEKSDFRCSCQSVSRREVQQAKRKRSRILRSLRCGEWRRRSSRRFWKQDGREEEEGRHGREKKEATTVATSRPSCAKNSSVSALISIVCFLLGRRGFWPRMVPGSGFESVSWENGH